MLYLFYCVNSEKKTRSALHTSAVLNLQQHHPLHPRLVRGRAILPVPKPTKIRDRHTGVCGGVP